MTRYFTDRGEITMYQDRVFGELLGDVVSNRVVISDFGVSGKEGMAIEIAAPGVKAENLSITQQGNILSIEINDPRMNFSRSYRLPPTVDPTTIEACYENGLLTLSAPKADKEADKEIRIVEVK